MTRNPRSGWWMAVFLAATYPFTKRFLALPQAYLGVAFGFGIPMAFAAVQERRPSRRGCCSRPTSCGRWPTHRVRDGRSRRRPARGHQVVGHLLRSRGRRRHHGLLRRVPVAAASARSNAIGAGWPFHLGCGIAFGFALYHYVLIRERTGEGCFRAFRHNNWVGFAVFAGAALGYAVR